MVLSGFARTQPDLGDARLVSYLLEHGWRWLSRQSGHLDFWSPPFFHPAKNVGAYSEVLLGALPVYVPFRLFLAPDRAFQAWILALGVLNFVSAYLLFTRCFRLGALAASAGAALFAFGAARVNMVMHYQLFPHFWTVVVTYALFRLLEKPTSDDERRPVFWIFLFSFAAVAQLYAGFYLGWFLSLALALAALFSLVVPTWRARLFAVVRAHPYSLVLAAVLGAAAIAPMMVHYLQASQEIGLRSFEEALTMTPRPLTWLHLGQHSWWYGWMAKLDLFRGIPMEHEQRPGMGLCTTALAVAGLVMGRRRPAVALFALVGLALVLVATLYGGFAPWKFFFDHFPGAKAVRAVARISLLVLFPAGLGVALFLQHLAQKGRAFALGAMGLGLLTVVEQGQTTPSYDFHANRRDVADIARAIGSECRAFVFSPVQGYGPYWKYQVDAMWASLEKKVPTLNGYSGSAPPGWQLGLTNLHSPYDEMRVGAAIQSWVSQRGLDPAGVCWVRVGLQEGGPVAAEFVSQSVPSTMVAGKALPVVVRMKNVGTEVWARARGMRLGAISPQDNTSFGTARVELERDVRPGETAEFRFEAVPPQQGRYTFHWRMVWEGVRWFGAQSEPVVVDVAPPEAASSSSP